MRKLKINSELFVIEDGKDYILYLPLRSVSAKVNADTIKLLNAINEGKYYDSNLDVIRKLIDIGVFEETIYPFEDSLYKPTHVTFLPSFNCNLLCHYCFSNGGEDTKNKISIEAAHKAIDLICKNASELNKKYISIGFHGGGEPMIITNKSFMENIINYTRLRATDNELKYRCSAVTNGVDISRFNIDWLKNNFTRFNISLDGPPDIQNFQRPKKGIDKDSYEPVLNTIKLFENNNIDYSLRATITKYSVNRMSEIVEHFSKISNKKIIHLEPLFECGRCHTSNFEAPTPEDFIDNYLKASETAKKLGLKIHYSGASKSKISDRFCGAAGDNFFITPDSYVTTCLEACRSDEIENDPFIIGKYKYDTKEYEFYDDKIAYLKSRRVTNIKSCSNCLCKFSCSGDCLAKVLKNSGNMFDTANNYRCKINITLTEMMIKDIIC